MMSHQQPNRSPVALGGIMAALAVVLGLTAVMLPFVSGVIAPLPLALAAIWLSWRGAVLAGVAASLVLGIITGPLAGVSFFLQTVLIGIVSGALVRAKKRYGTLFALTTATQVLGTLLYLLVQLALMGFDVRAFMGTFGGLEEEMLASAEQLDLYNTMANTGGMSAAQAEHLFTNTVHIMVQLSPSIYVLMFAVMTGAELLLLSALCRRLRTPVQVQAPNWKTIIMPPAVLVPFLAAWVLLLVEQYLDNQLLWIVAANVMVIGAAFMAVGGASYLLAKLKFTEKPLMLQLLIIMLALFMGWYLILMCALLGIFDSIADYRHLRPEKGEQQ